MMCSARKAAGLCLVCHGNDATGSAATCRRCAQVMSVGRGGGTFRERFTVFVITETPLYSLPQSWLSIVATGLRLSHVQITMCFSVPIDARKTIASATKSLVRRTRSFYCSFCYCAGFILVLRIQKSYTHNKNLLAVTESSPYSYVGVKGVVDKDFGKFTCLSNFVRWWPISPAWWTNTTIFTF